MWSELRRPLPVTGSADVPALLDRLERERAAHPLLIWEPFNGPSETWTYGRFLAYARQLAAGLQRRGLAPGDRVALMLDNSPDFLLTWVSVVLAGGVAVCLNTHSTRDELAYYGSHADIAVAIAGPT